MFELAYQLEVSIRLKGFRVRDVRHRHHSLDIERQRDTISALVFFLPRKLKFAFEIRCTAASIQVPRRVPLPASDQSLSDMELNPNSGNSKLLVNVCAYLRPSNVWPIRFINILDFLSIDASSRLGKPANFQPWSNRPIKRILKPAVMSVSHKLTGIEWGGFRSSLNEYSKHCWTEMHRSHKTIPTNKYANCVTNYIDSRSEKQNTKYYRFTDLSW